MIANYARRVAAAAVSSDVAGLRALRSELTRERKHTSGVHEGGVYDGLLRTVDAVQDLVGRGSGLAPQAAPLEPGSLPARMLLEVAGGVRGANADLADRLATDHWQVSRAGRKLRELGLATRVRTGRLNGWTVTKAGATEATRLRQGVRRSSR